LPKLVVIEQKVLCKDNWNFDNINAIHRSRVEDGKSTEVRKIEIGTTAASTIPSGW